MTSYLFVFGRTPKLAHLELTTFFPKVRLLKDEIAILETNENINPTDLINKLGGTVKIGKSLGTLESVTPQAFAEFLQTKESRIVFGVSSYLPNFRVTRQFLSQVKLELESKGYGARFVESRDEGSLSSVVILKQKVNEFILVPSEDKIMIARTLAVQPFTEWNKRDYGRPYADPHAGMLPPKVARMAVNIVGFQKGLNPIEKGSTLRPIVLLDPFCGMGTILGEALLVGWRVVGSDRSETVIEKARKNLEWLISDDSRNRGTLIPGIESQKLFLSDATHVSEKLPKKSVDAIVTEPFMGAAWESGINKLNQSNQLNQIKKIKNIIKGLEKLYIGCLKDWAEVLKTGGKVVIALPEYAVGGRTFFVKKVLDMCEILGYTVLTGPIEYSRPQATVRRKFFVLTKLA